MAQKLLKGIIQFLEIACSAVLFAMMLLTFVDVIGRYFLGAPIFGASEIISTLLALTIFLGLGIANAQDKHIVVSLIDQRVRNFSPKIYDIIVHGFSLLTMSLIVYVLSHQALEAAERGSTTIVLEWPLAWIVGGIAALAGLSVICQALGLLTGAHASSQHTREGQK